MKKSKIIFIVGVMFFVITGVVLGAWQEGTNNYCMGNLGVGTNNPGDGLSWQNPAFHVNGIRPTVNLTTTQIGGLTTIRMQGPSSNSQLHLNFVDGNPWQLKFYSYQQGNDIIKILGNGNVGIGTSPGEKLDVEGNGNFVGKVELAKVRGNVCRLALYADDVNGGMIGYYGNPSYLNAPLRFGMGDPPTEKMRITQSGNVGIGETNPQYKLAVNGTIKAKEVIVSLTGWSDYVLQKSYKLLSLQKLEKYITQNGHLPGIPSEQKVKKEGVGVGDMQAKLLAKVEELTLYMIDQNKKIAALEVENAKLKEMMAKIVQGK